MTSCVIFHNNFFWQPNALLVVARFPENKMLTPVTHFESPWQWQPKHAKWAGGNFDSLASFPSKVFHSSKLVSVAGEDKCVWHSAQCVNQRIALVLEASPRV